ncbi:MAG: hypothetical protein NC548_05385 [Lachnospiraceae bacterium]|nr:hypothetical protein [Lachnospiraceae bacterium]
MSLEYYPEMVKAMYPDALQGVDPAILDNMKILLNSITNHACPAPGFPTDQAVGEAATDFEMLVEAGWRALYMLPANDLEDLPEKWLDVTDSSPLKGMPVTVQKKPTEIRMVIHKVELHTDTINGSPAAVYRLNGDSRLCIMLYANTVAYFNVPAGHQFQDATLQHQYAISAFIEEFPFHVGWPLTTQVFRYTDNDGKPATVGLLSDIRNQHQDPIDDPDAHLYTPMGTRLYLEDVSWIPNAWLVKDEPKSSEGGVIPFPKEKSADGVVSFDK